MSVTLNGKLKGKAARTVEATGIARGTETEELANSQWNAEFALRDLLVDDMTPELARVRYAIAGAFILPLDEKYWQHPAPVQLDCHATNAMTVCAADEETLTIGGEPVFNSREWFDSIPEIPF
jgi:hypothetical protein